MTNFDFRDRLLALRAELNLSQHSAAALIGISCPLLCRLERGSACNPTILVVRLIANAYGVSVSYLIGDTDERGAPARKVWVREQYGENAGTVS